MTVNSGDAGQRYNRRLLSMSYLDSNIGQILDTLEASGQANNTSIIYSSDHGDNAGARRLWGKSNMYEESAAIPMIAVGQLRG